MTVRYRLNSLRAPHGVAFANNTLAVVVTGAHELRLYDAAGLPGATPVVLGGLGTAANAEGFLFPAAACFVADDDLIVADTQNKHLDRYRLRTGVWGYDATIAEFDGITPGVGYIVDVVREREGSVLLLDATHRRVLRLTLGTGAISLFHAEPAWRDPSALAVGGGFVWVADAGRHQIYRYAPNLDVITFGRFGRGPGELRAPSGLVVDESVNQIYIAEADNSRISLFELDGTFRHSIALPGPNPHSARKLALDASGSLIVADASANCVFALDPAGSSAGMQLSRSNLSFGAIGVGYRVTQPISVLNNADETRLINAVRLQGTGFTAVGLPPLPVSLPPRSELDLTVQFAAESRGLVAGELAVDSDDIDSPTLFAALTGEGFLVPPMALALVLDRSGSMTESSGTQTKMERLKSASSLLVDLLRRDAADELSVTSFSTEASVVLPSGTVTPTLVADAHNAINRLTASGRTAIGAGLALGLAEVQRSDITRHNVVLFTDGKENQAPLIEDIAVPPGDRVFAVGLGLPELIDAAKLQSLATGTGGYFQVTDGADYLLPKFFIQIFSDLSGQSLAVDPLLTFSNDGVKEVPVLLSRGESSLSVVLTWEHAKSVFLVSMVSPEGRVFTESDFDSVVRRDRYLIGRITLRGKQRGQAGRWLVRVLAQKISKEKIENAVLSVLVNSDHHLRWSFRPEFQQRHSAKGPRAGRGWWQPTGYPDPGMVPLPAPPSDLRQGDRLFLDIGPLVPTYAVDGIVGKNSVVGGRTPFVFTHTDLWIRPPVESLTQRAAKVGEMDHVVRLMETPPSLFTPGKLICDFAKCVFYALTGRQIVKTGSPSTLVDRSKDDWVHYITKPSDKTPGKIVLAIPLDGPDGVYEGTVRIFARTSRGDMFQRERGFCVLVSP